MENKLQVYYQPNKGNAQGIKSLSVSYSEFDIEHDTYREKIVLEKNGEKYKIKRFWGALSAFLPKIQNLDFNHYPKTDIDFDKEYYYVKFGDQTVITNNKDDIADILSIVHFDKILAYDVSEYQKKS